MATTPTLATIRQSYVTYSSYEEDGDQTACKSFITACRRLLVMLPAESEGKDGTRLKFELAEITKAMEYAQDWLASNPTSTDETNRPAALHHDFEAFQERE